MTSRQVAYIVGHTLAIATAISIFVTIFFITASSYKKTNKSDETIQVKTYSASALNVRTFEVEGTRCIALNTSAVTCNWNNKSLNE